MKELLRETWSGESRAIQFDAVRSRNDAIRCMGTLVGFALARTWELRPPDCDATTNRKLANSQGVSPICVLRMLLAWIPKGFRDFRWSNLY